MSRIPAKKRPKALELHHECMIVALGLMCTMWLMSLGPSQAANDGEAVCVGVSVIGLDNGDPGVANCAGVAQAVSSASSSSASSASSSSSVASSVSSSAASAAQDEPDEEDEHENGGRRGTIEQSEKRIRCLIDAWERKRRLNSESLPFTDVPDSAWYRESVDYLWDCGFLDDAPLLHPNRDATRAEAAKLLVNMKGIELQDSYREHFDDVSKSAWYFGYVEESGRMGWMKGYDNCYGSEICFTQPEATITRAEAAALIVRVMEFRWMGDAPRFVDNGPGPWYVRTVQIAADHCVLHGDDDAATVRPQDEVTRAELMTMIRRALQGRTYRDGCGATHEPVPSILRTRRTPTHASSSTTKLTLSFQDGLPSLERSIAEAASASSPVTFVACLVRSAAYPSALRCMAEQSARYGHALLATLRMPDASFIQSLHPSEPVSWVIALLWCAIAGRLLFLFSLRFIHTHARRPGH